jgi:hypothetical protein
MNEIISLTDAVYTIVIYLFFAIQLGKIIDNVFTNIFTSDENISNIHLLLQCSVQVAITAVIAFPCRKLISKIPFPFNGYNGYSRINLNEISDDATIIWSAFILGFEPNLVKKIKKLQKTMTTF